MDAGTLASSCLSERDPKAKCHARRHPYTPLRLLPMGGQVSAMPTPCHAPSSGLPSFQMNECHRHSQEPGTGPRGSLLFQSLTSSAAPVSTRAVSPPTKGGQWLYQAAALSLQVCMWDCGSVCCEGCGCISAVAPHRRDKLGMQHLTLGLAAEEGKGFDKGFGLDSWDAKKYYPGLLHRIQGGGAVYSFALV